MKNIIVLESIPLLRQQVVSVLNQISDVPMRANIEQDSISFKNLLDYDWIWLDSKLTHPADIVAIKSKYQHLKIIIFGFNDTIADVHTFYKYGIDGYLSKTSSVDAIKEMIVTINQGVRYFSKELAFSIQNWSNRKVKMLNVVSRREKEVLNLIIDGYSTKEIAEKLFIATCTVETHRLNLLQKLEAKNTAELVCKAIQNRLWGDWKF